MTTIESELARLSIGLISEPKVAVTRQFLADVLAKLQALKSAATDRRVCQCCETPPPYEIPLERVDATPYQLMQGHAVERMQGRV